MKTNTTTIGTTTAEAEVLAATAAAIAAGQDPFGDDEDEAAEAVTGADEGATTTDDGQAENGEALNDEGKGAAEGEDGEGEGDALTPEQLAAIAADDEAPQPAPAKRYNAADPAELKTKREEQLAVKAKAMKDLMDGLIEPEEFSRIDAEVGEALEAIAVQRTLHEANVQTERQVQETALDRIIEAAKKANEVDYRADPKAAKQFDTAMAMLAQDGETRTYAELVADAHKAVLAIRGLKPAAPAATPARPRENGKGPMTLRNVPAAETPNSGGGWKEQLASLSGQAYEEAFAKLSPGQKAELMSD